MHTIHPSLVFLLFALALASGCGGGSGGGTDPGGDLPSPPTNLSYATSPVVYATETPIADNVLSWEGGTPDAIHVTPPLPAGLTLDASTGTIAGTTTKQLAARTTYRVTASNAGGSTFVDLEMTVGVLDHLAAGYTAEVVAEGLLTPNKFALAPDGRIFFNELRTGDTRVLLTDGSLQATPFAHQDVTQDAHQGLLGIVLHPDFTTNGWVYLMACTKGVGPLNDRIRVLRYTSMPGQSEGTEETVIVDDLPLGPINNGGDLVFGTESPEPRLYVSLGDLDQMALAQTDGSRAGRVLRYAADGTIPGDNPIPGDPEWCRGLRNTFGIDYLATNERLYGADNGPTSNDELNFLFKGKNFEWGASPGDVGAGEAGIVMRTWVTVIVPTGLAFHDGAGWGTEYENDLFMSSYDDEAIRRFQLLAPIYADIDREEEIATFRPETTSNKPLDLEVAADGALYVSTFSGIYRIDR